MRFEGKVALVTGASSGIGRATAERLAADGAAVAMIDIRSDRNEAAAAELTERGGNVRAWTTDISDEQAMAATFEQVTAHFGGLDLAAAVAGINGTWAPIGDLTAEDWRRTLDVNLIGSFLTVKCSISPMQARGGGAIAICSSINGPLLTRTVGSTAYSSSKAAQLTLTRKAAHELAQHNIRVNAVLPGSVTTNLDENTHWVNLEALRGPRPQMSEEQRAERSARRNRRTHPLRQRQAQPAEVADTIAFLLSDDARHVTGAELAVDGGEALA